MINVIADRRRDYEIFSRWAGETSSEDRTKMFVRCAEIAKDISSNDSILAAKHIELIEKVELSNAAVAIGIDAETLLERDRFSFAMSAPRW